MFLSKELNDKWIDRLQIILIVVFSTIPLFIKLPFKINLFLAWDGAYRISSGQIPFKDFYLPMGFGFWIIPAVFLKIFGPFLSSLIKAQVLINLIGAFAFRSILKKLDVPSAKVFLSLLVFCISFVFINFWPWYNNTVFIFQLVAIHFLLAHIFSDTERKKYLYLFASAFFLVLAFFTKQDGGALAVITTATLLLYNAWVDKKIKWVLVYLLFGIVLSGFFVLPFIQYDFFYWFNVGQTPHNSRVNLSDILKDVFEGSEYIKLYLLLIGVIIVMKVNANAKFIYERKEMLFVLLTLFILIQAMLVQVTSYIPHNVNVYFHSFAFAFIISVGWRGSVSKMGAFALLCLLVFFWQSADVWRYSQRMIERIVPGAFARNNTLNQVSKYSWFVPDSSNLVTPIKWKMSSYKAFDNVMLPEGTIAGIDSIMKMKVVKKKDLKVLNMSELTPLAYELKYTPSTGEPMWYHKNVAIFDKQIQEYCEKISNHHYDLVLFEEIPNLNQFNPEDVRKSLQKHYKLANSFQAPRDNATNFIEVYVRPED